MLGRLARFKTSTSVASDSGRVHLIATQAQATISPQKLELPGRDLIFGGCWGQIRSFPKENWQRREAEL
jgi:hypothetical protein